MRKIFKRILIGFVVVTLLVGAGVAYYVNDYYHATPTALAVLEQDNVSISANGDIYFTAVDLEDHDEDDLIVFYPGGKVEETAYLPLAGTLAQSGLNVVIVKMPFRLAVLGSNRADNYVGKIAGIENYYLMGHSLGGAMASDYASKHQDEVSGLVLLGAYRYGDYPISSQLTIYGENDLVLDRERIDYDENVIVITGGNHAGFGNYGNQDGDGIAAISNEQQQEITGALIKEFILEGDS